mgnify:CR=1 FL=1
MDGEKLFIDRAVKVTRKQINLIQLALAGLVVVICALLSADLVRISLGLWFGALWLAMAWCLGLSPLLMSLLVMMALRGEASSGLATSWWLSINLGLSAVTLASYRKERWAAVVTALCWGAMMWGSPALFICVLAGFPRFNKMFGDHGRWFVVPGLLLFLGLTGTFLFEGSMNALIERPFQKERFQEFQQLFYQLFSIESLWRILPVVGIFEIAQKQPDDHRFTWRNLILFGALVSLLIVPLAPAMQMVYFVGLPLSAILLTRWCLALPDLISRSVYCLGMACLALPFLQGGLS